MSATTMLHVLNEMPNPKNNPVVHVITLSIEPENPSSEHEENPY